MIGTSPEATAPHGGGETAAPDLARLIQEARRAVTAVRGERLIRVTQEVEPLDPLRWLVGAPAEPRFFWQARDEARAWAGIGIADEIADPSPARLAARRNQMARSDPAIRYFGGMRFRPGISPGGDWEEFGEGRFVLPRLELAQNGDRSELALNLVLPRDRHIDLDHLVASFVVAANGLEGLPRPLSRAVLPDRRQWRESVAALLGEIARGDLRKVVLARRVRHGFGQRVDPAVLLTHLRSASPNAFHFLFEPVPGRAFLGASPERLFRWSNGAVETEAVAGTRPRVDDPAIDGGLRADLQNSAKDQDEHRHVIDYLVDAFEAARFDVRVSRTEVLDLATSRHLRTPIEAVARNGARSADLLTRLHPTPAVAGVPMPAALDRISALEPFDRGWYAGPIGWLGADEAEFAVAIRSGLLRSDGPRSTLDLFSGAGIVGGSEADAEWDELDHKLADYERLLATEEV